MPAHGLAPQNFSPDKRVDVCVDGDEDRGSTPLASSPESFRGCRGVTTLVITDDAFPGTMVPSGNANHQGKMIKLAPSSKHTSRQAISKSSERYGVCNKKPPCGDA